MAKIAINGFGRIGRAAFKTILDTPGLELVAINDPAPVEGLAYLLGHDSVYGRYEKKVECDESGLVVDGTRFGAYGEKEPSNLPWGELGIDIVLECSGVFNRIEELERHISAGAKGVVLSAPTGDERITTVVPGVNEPKPPVKITSCASSTVNCVAPLLEIIDRRIGVSRASMTAVHAWTSTQALVDCHSVNPRLGRAAPTNLVPVFLNDVTSTARVLPGLAGRLGSMTVRGPVAAGSLAQVAMVTERATTADEVNAIFEEEAGGERYGGIVGVTAEPLVSSDIIGDSRASVVDLAMTRVVDSTLLTIVSWFDNEWGYACQVVREAARMAGTLR